MTITSGTHPKLLWPGVKKFWGMAYADQKLMFSELFDQETSDKSYEETVEMSGFGLAPAKAEASSISYDTTVNGYTTRFTNVVYGLGFIVTEEAAEDNQYKDQAERRAKALKRSMRHTKEWVHANVFNRAFDSGYLGGDGKEMIATDHPTANGTQSNELATAADLSQSAIEDLLIMLRRATDTRGLIMNLQPVSLLTSPNDEFNAERILKSSLQSDSAENATNALKGKFSKGAKSWSFLTDTDAWFIETDSPDGTKTFNRRALSFEKDGDFETGNFKHKSTERYVAGWDDWRRWYGSGGAS
jgi:hypothetical protein